jgi:hypothetical protein
MHGKRRFAGIGLVGLAGLVVASAAAPTGATVRAKYRFKFTSAVRMDWQWPVNPHNRNRRDTQAFRVVRGSGCGTAPGRAVWKVVYETPDSGLPQATLKIDIPHQHKNPAPVVDAHYGGEPTAEVKGFLKFGITKVTLSAVPTGDVVGPTFNPATATITKKRVSHC